MAQNKGCALGDVGSGKLTRSTVTCPKTPLLYKTFPIDVQIDFMFIFGKDYCGKKHPALIYSFAENLSKLPNS